LADTEEATSAEKPELGAEMTFLEHLGELRKRIFWAAAGILAATIICLIFVDFLVESLLLLPAKNAHAELQNLRPFGQIFLYFEVGLIGGIVLSIPNIFYQLWRFIAPALRARERKYIVWIVIFSTVCFLAGIVFAYFVMLPMTMAFAAQFGSQTIKNQFAIDEYLQIIISVMLAAGVVFELPMISFFLSRLGILTPAFMRKYRRHAIVIILFLAAILTPGTDPVSQIILAVPLLFLYEISIIVSKFSAKRT
jgi:sec-independent protein translocase protein TatC